MRALSFVLIAAVATGCARTREPAPQDLDGLVHYLFRNFEDPVALQDAMENLTPWLEDVGRTEAAQEGFVLTSLAELDVAAFEHPDRNLGDAIGVVVGGVSPFTVHEHAEAILLDDQVFTDPTSYSYFDREIVEGDPIGFAACADLVRTHNLVEKTKMGVTIPYELEKDFRWVELGDEPDDQRTAIVAVAWVPESACNEGGGNCVNQSFSMEVYYDQGLGDTVRLMASYNEVKTSADSILTFDAKVAIAVNGIRSIFESTDAFLAGDQE